MYLYLTHTRIYSCLLKRIFINLYRVEFFCFILFLFYFIFCLICSSQELEKYEEVSLSKSINF